MDDAENDRPNPPAAETDPAHLPAWRRVTERESRWAASAAALVAAALQLLLPRRLNVHPIWVLPALEMALAVGLVAADPLRVGRRTSVIRIASIVLATAVSFGNAWAAGNLVRELVSGHGGDQAGPLLANGGSVWLTNVIVFALWYWETDRGGPAARARASRTFADFQFPQMENPSLAPPDWEPGFIDYLYLSFTNATAFSPTDVMPLARWAKLAMLVQSLISLVVVALVIARAVNIFR